MKKKEKPVKAKGEKFFGEKQSLIWLSFVLSVILGIGSGLYFTFGALSEGQNSLKELPVIQGPPYSIGIQLDDGVTVEYVDQTLKTQDPTYKGLISQYATVKTKIFNKDGKKELESYALIYGGLTEREGVLFKDTETEIPEGCYAAYYAGWEWSERDLGKKYKMSLTKSDGTKQEIEVIAVGHFKPEAMVGAIAGEPYVYSNRSMLVIDGFDVTNISPKANEMIFVFTSKNVVDFSRTFNFGKIKMRNAYGVPLGSELTKYADTKIFISYLYAALFIFSILVISFTGGRNRAYCYLLYGGINTVAMLIAYFLIAKKTYGLYAYQNVFSAWFAGLMAATPCLVLFAAIIERIISAYKCKKAEEKDAADDEASAEYA